MIVKFTDYYLQELAEEKPLVGKHKFSEEVIKAFRKRVFQIKNATSSHELRNIKSLHYEKLKEKRYAGKFSIRIDRTYRLIFAVNKQGNIEIFEIDEISKHYS